MRRYACLCPIHSKSLNDQMSSDCNWPALKTFANCWPVCGMLKLTVKYGVEASRRAGVRATNARLRAALRGQSPIVSPQDSGHTTGQDS